MAVNLYCYDCSLDIAAGKKLCGNCGLEALIGAGSILDSGSDEYTIDRTLGRGGMGMTYVAINQAGDEVVVKQLFEDSDPGVHAENLMRFEREARIQKSISHPRFPAGYGYWTEAGIHFMAMELIPGDNVDNLLTSSGKFSEEQSLEIGIQICEGALALHNHKTTAGTPDRIIHRDIKPNNLILKTSGEIVILDLGIARPETQSAATQNRMTGSLGTTVYMAKEQLMQNPVITSDQYSIAATMYHMVLGQTLPEPYPQRPAAIDRLPHNWQPVFRRALDDDYTLRFPTVREFQIELVKLLPAALQTMYAALLPQQQATAAPLPVSIRFVPSSTGMINPGEYRQSIAGQVRIGNQGFANARVAPFIIDLGAGARNGTPVVTDQFGNFTLAINDITVPVRVGRRTIEIVIQDPMTAAEVHRETVMIDKPWSATSVRIGAGFSHTMATIGKGLASPFKAMGQSWHNHQLAQAGIVQARANAKAARINANSQTAQAKQVAKVQKYQAKSQTYQAKMAQKQANRQAKAAAKLANQQAKAQAKAAARAARAAAGGPEPFPWWAIALTLIFLVLAGVGLVWRYPVLWIGAPPLVALLAIIGGELRRQKQFWIRRMAWGIMSTLWLAVAILVVAADK